MCIEERLFVQRWIEEIWSQKQLNVESRGVKEAKDGHWVCMGAHVWKCINIVIRGNQHLGQLGPKLWRVRGLHVRVSVIPKTTILYVAANYLKLSLTKLNERKVDVMHRNVT